MTFMVLIWDINGLEWVLSEMLARPHIGCHSLRKTFGYHSWKKGVPIAVLMELYNHSNQAVTKLYLGISQDDIDDVYRLVEL